MVLRALPVQQTLLITVIQVPAQQVPLWELILLQAARVLQVQQWELVQPEHQVQPAVQPCNLLLCLFKAIFTMAFLYI